MALTFRSLDFLGGQSAPRASDGIGIKILYRCAACQQVWLQDGARITLDLGAEQVQALASDLHANLSHLPLSTCRLCLYRTEGGVTEIDEYGPGKGFGFSWEYLLSHRPVHGLLLITSLRWLKRSSSSGRLPDIVTHPRQMRAILSWFVGLAEPPQRAQPLDPLTCSLLASSNAPGYGQPGTELWIWQGWRGQMFCPVLHEQAELMLALALPPTTALSCAEVLSVEQSLAALTLLGAITGEQNSSKRKNKGRPR